MLHFFFLLISGLYVIWTCFHEIHPEAHNILGNWFRSATTEYISYKMTAKKKLEPATHISTHYNRLSVEDLRRSLRCQL